MKRCEPGAHRAERGRHYVVSRLQPAASGGVRKSEKWNRALSSAMCNSSGAGVSLRAILTAALVFGASACLPGNSKAAAEEVATEEEVTFARDVAPILIQHCISCHRTGASAPFSLVSYTDARKRVRQIADVVQRRFMPPWLPEPGYGEFANNRRLTDEEIALIVRWAELGGPLGDPSHLPPVPPQPEEGWQLGQPDLVLKMPETYILAADGPDVFRNFVLPVELSSVKYVRAVEFRVGNPRVVHHANLKVDHTDSSRLAELRDPEPGFDGMDGVNARFPDGHIIGWTPGKVPSLGREGLAWRLDPGADVLLMLHLTPRGRPEPVQVSVGLFFADSPPSERPYSLRLGSQTLDIPPGESAYTVEDSYVLPIDVDVLSIYPHAHFIGRAFKVWATLPDGSTQPLLWIRNWDFNWQDDYDFLNPVTLPKGSTIHTTIVYDNSVSNPLNPNIPPRRVVYGPNSRDEMGDVWIQALPRNPDEYQTLVRDFERKELHAEIAGHEHLVQLNPTSPELRASLAHRYIMAGRIDDAVARLQESVQLNPHFAAGYCNLGVVLASQGRPEEAERQFRNALQSDPNYPEAHLNLGLALQSQRKFAEAIPHLQRAVELKPTLAAAHVALGNLLRAQGNMRQAATHFRHATELRPEDALARHNLGTTLLALGDMQGAIDALTSALALNPAQPETHAGLARALKLTGQSSNALNHLHQALELRPDYLPALIGAAWILATHPDAQHRNPAVAMQFAQRAVTLTNHRDAGALDVLAAAYAAQGNFEQAIRIQLEAIDLARAANAAALGNELTKRLQLYQRGQPFIDHPPPGVEVR